MGEEIRARKGAARAALGYAMTATALTVIATHLTSTKAKTSAQAEIAPVTAPVGTTAKAQTPWATQLWSYFLLAAGTTAFLALFLSAPPWHAPRAERPFLGLLDAVAAVGILALLATLTERTNRATLGAALLGGALTARDWSRPFSVA